MFSENDIKRCMFTSRKLNMFIPMTSSKIFVMKMHMAKDNFNLDSCSLTD